MKWYIWHLMGGITLILWPWQIMAQQNTNYTVVSKAAHQRVWQRVLSQTNLDSSVSYKTNSITELATGMHFWNGSDWITSDPSFQSTTNGFAATNTQHKVQLNADLNASGAVSVTTASGILLQSTPIAIALYDTATSNYLVIGQLTNSLGVQAASNQVDYPSAFSGVCADVLYTMGKASFMQDIVFNGQINPTNYGFPSNTTQIQIITEFYVKFGTESNNDISFATAGAAYNFNYTMVTVVRNSLTNASIYLNGVLSANKTCISPAPSTNELRIGADLTGSSIMDGNIWMVQIWSTPLRQTDVANLYLHQINGTPWP